MDEKIRDAYRQMAPTDEQIERMWENVKAQAEGPDEGAAPQKAAPGDRSPGEAGSEPGSFPIGPDSPSASSAPKPNAKRGKFKAWKVAIPIAACLVLGAVVVGVNSASNLMADNASVQHDLHEEAADAAASANAGAAAMTTMALEAEGFMESAIDVAPIDTVDNFNTEEYAAVDENGFISTRTRPLSTVSADVDTASYANVRRMVSQGYALDEIPSGAVRAEEMLNYFTYDYAAPTGGNLFSMQAQASTCPWNPDTQLLVLGFATQRESPATSKGANLVFLIDVSGSMDSPDKLDLLQDSFATLLESLDGDDRVSIVTYSGQEEVVLEGARGDDDAQILKAIYRLRASGSTNGEAGLRMAYEVARRNFIDGGVNRIVMASDGDLNVGMTSTSDLYDFVEAQRDTGVYLSVLGFGSGNYKDTKMEVLADHGNGSYHYIDCTEEAERVLGERLMANLVPFADDVKVQVEFNPAQVKAYRLIGYENRELPDEAFLDDAADAGDVGPNAQFTVAYEVVLADSAYDVPDVPDLKYGATDYAGDDSSDWLTCSLRYRAFADGAVHEQSLIVDSGDATARPSDDWTFASAVIEFAMLAADSHYLGSASPDSVLALLDGMDLSPERAGFRSLVEAAAE